MGCGCKKMTQQPQAPAQQQANTKSVQEVVNKTVEKYYKKKD